MYKCLGYTHVHTRIAEPLLVYEHDSKAGRQYSKQNAWANHDPSRHYCFVACENFWENYYT